MDARRRTVGDVMDEALEGYALVKVSGRNKGLEGLSDALSARFARSGKKVVKPAVG